MYLDELLRLPRSGIYGIVDEVTHSIWISFSLDCMDSISRNVKDIRDKHHKVDQFNINQLGLTFIFIEEVQNRFNLRLRSEYWIDIYRNKGYTILNSGKLVQYKLRSVIEKPTCIKLYLVSNNNEKHLIGIFDRKLNLDNWINRHYPNNKIDYIRYQNSKAVTDYYNELYRFSGMSNPVKIKENFFVINDLIQKREGNGE